jgi:hypothetical protein
LLTLIANKPDLRAVQLADRVDQPVDSVEALLRPHLVAGNVYEEEVTAPNNRPAMAYHLSEVFKASEAFRAIRVRSDCGAGEEPVAATAKLEPAAEQAPASGCTETDAAAGAPADAASRIERAIACVQYGSVSNDQMRVAIGLRVNQFPVNFLRRALEDGRLARDGGNWVLGPALTDKGKPAQVDPRKPKAGVVLPASSPAPTSSIALATVPAGFRCAVWSDGILELQRGGVTFACLTPDERAELKGLLAA